LGSSRRRTRVGDDAAKSPEVDLLGLDGEAVAVRGSAGCAVLDIILAFSSSAGSQERPC
jgi:hypothetical protein